MVIIWCDGVRLKANQSCDVTRELIKDIGNATDDIEPSQDNKDTLEEKQLLVTPLQHPATLRQRMHISLCHRLSN